MRIAAYPSCGVNSGKSLPLVTFPPAYNFIPVSNVLLLMLLFTAGNKRNRRIHSSHVIDPSNGGVRGRKAASPRRFRYELAHGGA